MEEGGRLSNSTNSIQTILLPSNGSSNLSSNGSKSYMDISNFVKKKYNNTKKAPEVRISLSDFNFGKDPGPENKISGIGDPNAGSKRDSSEGGFGDDQVHVVAVDEEKLARKEEDIIELWNKFNKVNADILNFMQEKDLIMREIVETKSAINEIKLRTMEHKLFQKLSAKFHKNIPGSSLPSSAPFAQSQSVTPKQNKTTPSWNFKLGTPSKYKTLPRSPAQFKLVRPTPVAMPQSRNSPKTQTPVQMIRNRTRKYRLVSADSQDGCFETNEVQKAFSAENVWSGGQAEMKLGMDNEAKSFSTGNIWCGGDTGPKFGVAPQPIYGMDTKKYVSAEPIYGTNPQQGVAPEPIYGIISNHRSGRVSDVNYAVSAETKQDLTPKPVLAPKKEPIYAVSRKAVEAADRRDDAIKDNSNFAIVGDKIMRQAFNKRSFQVFEEDYSGLEAKPIDHQQFFKRNRRSRRSSIHYNKEEFEYIKAVLDKESAENNVDDEPIYEPIDGPIYENVQRRETKVFQEGVNLEEEVALNSERPVSANSQVFKCRMDPECEFQDEDQNKLKHHVTNVHLEARKSFEKSQENLLKKSDSSEEGYPTIKFDGGSLTSLTGNVGSVVDDDDDVFEEDPISLREIQQDQKSPPDRQTASVIGPDRLAASISPADRLADSVDSCDSGVDNSEPVSCKTPNPEVFQCRMDPECTYSGRNIEKHIATKHQKHLAELMKMAQKKK